MASWTADPSHPFPVGTSVSVYSSVGQRGFDEPTGTALTSAPVGAGGVLTFTGLTERRHYFAVAQVDAVWRWLRFYVGQDVELDPDSLLGRHAADATGVHGIDDAATLEDRLAALEAIFPIRVPFTIELFGPEPRSGSALITSVGQLTYAAPGSAASASLQPIQPEANATVIRAYWQLVWNPVAVGCGVQLASHLPGAADDIILQETHGTAGASPLNSTYDILDDMAAIWEEAQDTGIIRQVAQRMKGDGTNTPIVFASRIVMVLEVAGP